MPLQEVEDVYYPPNKLIFISSTPTFLISLSISCPHFGFDPAQLSPQPACVEAFPALQGYYRHAQVH